MNLKQIIREEIKRQLKESSQWAIGKSVQYKNLKTAKSKIAKIVKKLGNGKWELDGGHIAYEKDPEFKLMNEAYGSDFSGSGLVVKSWETVDDPAMPYVILKFDGGKTLRITQAKGASGRKTFQFILNQLKNYKTDANSKAAIDDMVNKNRIRIKEQVKRQLKELYEEGEMVTIKKGIADIGGKEVKLDSYTSDNKFATVIYAGQKYSVHASDIE